MPIAEIKSYFHSRNKRIFRTGKPRFARAAAQWYNADVGSSEPYYIKESPMFMPFGEIKGKVLTMSFSSADFSVASVIAALREHLDMLNEMQVDFCGIATDVMGGDARVFKPVMIVASFEYRGDGDVNAILGRVYAAVWKGIVTTFPDESEWADAKESYASFILSQADLIRARQGQRREED